LNLVFKHMTDAKIFNKIHYHDVDVLTCIYEMLMSLPTKVDHNKAKELRDVCKRNYKYKYNKLGISVITEGHISFRRSKSIF